ncbi:BglG family transcription antiterminator [Oceanobacillus chungangensis]|uniref:Ascorbate-specific PTS system EIIA component n=1 Tax=Oceanobacillus chungangensis TaxID=1229152 RepID=A0A3D8PJD4_9BACI|nr:BglG family transcription antiterminator [Oceanobacillus chungangensis]RDW15338.1 hypothetical protein CWR45_16225 [Oceanobacillus chungangensis]
MLNQRAANLLNVILSNRIITINQLITKLNCTRRQVSYDLEKINDWLDSNNLPTIENVREQGIVVNPEVRSKIYELLPEVDMFSYLPSQDDRMRLIFIKIFAKNDYLSVNHFTNLIKMSRNTVLSDIQLLKEEIDTNDIELTYNRQDGYNLTGNEFNIRSVAFKYVSHILQLPNGVQLLEQVYDDQSGAGEFQRIYKITYSMMIEAEKDLDVSFVDDQLLELTIFFLFLTFRMQNGNGCLLSSEIINALRNSDAYLASQKLLKNLSFPVPNDEIYYLSMHLLGLNTSYHERMFTNDDSSDLYSIIDQIISDFEKMACVTFTNSEDAKIALFLHLKPAYYRMKFNIPITNPHLEKIKQEYFDLFVLVKKSLSRLEELLMVPITEDEIGYITVHFGAFIKNQGLQYRRKRCIIICPNGVSTSYMLKKQMENLIPEVEVVRVTSPREYQNTSEVEIDFIISTITIKTEKPLIIVSPILTALDKSKIIQEVNILLYQKHLQLPKVNELMKAIKQFTTIHNEKALYQAVNDILTGSTVKDLGRIKPMLNDLLTSETIQMTEAVNDWHEAIRVAAKPLLNNKSIEEKYVDAMIENVEKIGPYIVLAPKVAIPHARPEDGVNKIGMSLLKINNPVSFSKEDKEKDVNLIFVIAAIDHEMHLKALSQLSELLEDESIVNQIIGVNRKEEILPFIEEFSY